MGFFFPKCLSVDSDQKKGVKGRGCCFGVGWRGCFLGVAASIAWGGVAAALAWRGKAASLTWGGVAASLVWGGVTAALARGGVAASRAWRWCCPRSTLIESTNKVTEWSSREEVSVAFVEIKLKNGNKGNRREMASLMFAIKTKEGAPG